MNLKNKLLLWQLKWYKRQGNDEKLKRVKLNDHAVSFRKSVEMLHAYREIFKGSIYAFPATSDSPYIIDCGAHIGMSIVFFKQHYPNSRILAFEPDPESFGLLQNNVKEFKNVLLQQKAVWTHNDGVIFDMRGDMSSHIVNKDIGNASHQERIPSARLSDYLSEPVDMLKLDIEGAEIDVLQDCKDRLHNVHHLFVEFHGKTEDPQKLERLLTIIKESEMDYYIKPAHDWSATPFYNMVYGNGWDVQLNIFCKRKV